MRRMRRAEDSSDGALLRDSGSDAAAFRVVYDRHAERIFGYFSRRVEDRQACYDLTAETFATLYLQRKKFDPKQGSLEQWLYGIARNHLARYHRKQSVESRAMKKLRVRHSNQSFDETDDVVDRLGVDEATPSLHAAMADLSEKDRQIVELRVLGGLSHAEIAAELGCSTGAARIRVFRSLKKLGNKVRVADSGLYEVGNV